MPTPEIAVPGGDRAKLRRARDFGIVSCEPNGPSAPRRPLHRVRLGVLAARHAGAAHGGRPHRLGRDGCARQVAGPARQHQPPEEAEGEEGCPQARQGSSLPPLAALLPPPAATVLRPATRRARRILTRPPPHRRAQAAPATPLGASLRGFLAGNFLGGRDAASESKAKYRTDGSLIVRRRHDHASRRAADPRRPLPPSTPAALLAEPAAPPRSSRSRGRASSARARAVRSCSLAPVKAS